MSGNTLGIQDALRGLGRANCIELPARNLAGAPTEHRDEITPTNLVAEHQGQIGAPTYVRGLTWERGTFTPGRDPTRRRRVVQPLVRVMRATPSQLMRNPNWKCNRAQTRPMLKVARMLFEQIEIVRRTQLASPRCIVRTYCEPGRRGA